MNREELSILYEDAFKKHQNSLYGENGLQKQLDDAVCLFNDQINVINPERHAMRDEIYDLYEFLKNFGPLGDAITPFSFVTESTGHADIHEDGNPNINSPKMADASGGVFRTVGLAGLFLAATPIAIGSVILDKVINSLMETKECQVIEGKIEQQKTAWEKEEKTIESLVHFYKDAAEISNIYRATLVTVRDTIKRVIIPELKGIMAFLYADAINNAIMNGEDTSELRIADIVEFNGGLYTRYYQFVKNTFAYYVVINKFFEHTVLTDILKDGVITEEEKETFNKQVSTVKLMGNNLIGLANNGVEA